MKSAVPALLILLIFAGCSSSEKVYYDLPVEFIQTQKKNEFIQKYSSFLQGKKIFIDPGHGGSDRRNKSRDSLIVEADANLYVSLALRDYLIEAGCIVEMSRDKDMTVDLKERSYMADRSGADIFISIHHNAPGSAEDDWTNYTSTYYHAKENDYEYEPCERNLARYIQRDLSYAMRNSGGPGSFDGTYSDYNIYPGEGFSVLRVTKIPSVLVECGFFTNPYQEKKLAINEFNRIEAWGIFKGIARYFAAGIPEILFVNESFQFKPGSQTFSFIISDSQDIDPASIEIWVDSVAIKNYDVEKAANSLKIEVKAGLKGGEHSIRIIAANKNGNYAFPFYKKINILK